MNPKLTKQKKLRIEPEDYENYWWNQERIIFLYKSFEVYNAKKIISVLRKSYKDFYIVCICILFLKFKNF